MEDEFGGAVREGQIPQLIEEQDIDPLTILPVGAAALRSAIADYVKAGLSKFVIRPSAAVESWIDESEWLADAILDLQT